MPAFVLDTNTVIDFFRGKGKVAQRLLAVAPKDVSLPAVAAYEVWVGVLRSQNAKRREVQYGHFLASIEVVPFDSVIGRCAAELRIALERKGESIGPMDVLIAGTALARNAILVTRDVREFGRIPGLKVANWYD